MICKQINCFVENNDFKSENPNKGFEMGPAVYRSDKVTAPVFLTLTVR